MKHFTLDEFKCKHCGKAPMDATFLARLDELRERCGFALIVNSGYRCPAYNDKVSSTGRNGPHTTGHAVDFAVSRHMAHILLTHALAMGCFTGIGVQQKGAARFIHLDDLREPVHAPRPTIWSY